MDRLTWFDDMEGFNRLLHDIGDGPQKAIDRLSEYEDLNFSPDTLKAIITEWREWADSKNDGRMLIMPCKVGDTVYAIMKGHVLAVDVVSFAWYEWQPCWTVNLLFDSKKTNGVYAYSIDRFGRDVFLTPEEAEAALKGATL